jgi:hypothetical protein
VHGSKGGPATGRPFYMLRHPGEDEKKMLRRTIFLANTL